jgi:hypothetical protein
MVKVIKVDLVASVLAACKGLVHIKEHSYRCTLCNRDMLCRTSSASRMHSATLKHSQHVGNQIQREGVQLMQRMIAELAALKTAYSNHSAFVDAQSTGFTLSS